MTSILEYRETSSIGAESAASEISLFHMPAPAVEAAARGRVLVVEDNPVNQKVIVQMLERRGFRTSVASNGAEALNIISLSAYDAVLMDCQMPVMDGYEATRAIRSLEGLSHHTPIIAVTANAMVGDREKCIEAGMDDYISKPVKIEALESMLERWISRRAPSPPIVAPPTESAQVDDVLDREALATLRELQDGDDDLIGELIGMYLEDTPAYITTIHNAILATDAHQMERAAHTLKGSSASLGARRMAAACLEVEKLGRSGSVEGAEELLARIRSEFDFAREALQAQL